MGGGSGGWEGEGAVTSGTGPKPRWPGDESFAAPWGGKLVSFQSSFLTFVGLRFFGEQSGS